MQRRITHQFFLIKVELGQHILRDKRANEFATYLALKALCNGQLRLSRSVIDTVCSLTGITRRTFYNHLQKLRTWNWIGTDGDWYFIRGFRRLEREYGITSKSATELDVSADLSRLKEWLFAAYIGHLTKHRANPNEGKRSPSTPTGKRFSMHRGERFATNSIGVEVIADIFGFSTATASRMKRRAEQAGYMHYQHNYYALNVNPELKSRLKQADPGYTHRLRYRDGTLHIQLTDTLSVDRKYKSKRSN